jgi:hypothetical protein
MRREVLLLEEMIDAAEQAHGLVAGIDLAHLAADRQRRDALLWNFTVLGEASGQLRAGFKERFRDVPGSCRCGCGTGSFMATGPSTWRSCTRLPRRSWSSSPINYVASTRPSRWKSSDTATGCAACPGHRHRLSSRLLRSCPAVRDSGLMFESCTCHR